MRLDELFDHAWSLNDEASLLSCRLIVLASKSHFAFERLTFCDFSKDRNNLRNVMRSQTTNIARSTQIPRRNLGDSVDSCNGRFLESGFLPIANEIKS